jgi:hypothetical protein
MASQVPAVMYYEFVFEMDEINVCSLAALKVHLYGGDCVIFVVKIWKIVDLLPVSNIICKQLIR